MPSNDDLQSLLAKYRVAPQIQATLDSALSRANERVDQQPVHTNIAEAVAAPGSTELQPATKYSGSLAPEISGSSPGTARPGERPAILPRTMGADVSVKKEDGHRNREAGDQKSQQVLPMD